MAQDTASWYITVQCLDYLAINLSQTYVYIFFKLCEVLTYHKTVKTLYKPLQMRIFTSPAIHATGCATVLVSRTKKRFTLNCTEKDKWVVDNRIEFFLFLIFANFIKVTTI